MNSALLPRVLLAVLLALALVLSSGPAAEAAGYPRLGERSARVKVLERALHREGTLARKYVNRTFGRATTRAVQRFQRTKRIAASGRVDAQTWRALGLALRPVASPVPKPIPRPVVYTDTPAVMAHRGLAQPTGAEATLASMAAAIRAGADLIEFDVRWTKDAVMVLAHDYDLARTSDCGPVLIADITWAELQLCTASDGGRIPSFDEAMAYLARTRVVVNPQIAPPPGPISPAYARQFFAAIARHRMARRTIISAWRIDMLQDLRRYGPPIGTRLALLWRDAQRPYTPAQVRRVAEVFMPAWTVTTREQVAAYRSAGLYVITWTTIDAASHRAATAQHPNAICTDDTVGLAKILGS